MRGRLVSCALIASAVFMLTLPALAAAKGQNSRVRVLLLDQDFTRVPEPDESMELMDTAEGRLLLGATSYDGEIEVWKSARAMYLVNDLPLERYVEGVVQAESGRGWVAEALKAQAVAVRTYVVSQMNSSERSEYHVTSSVLHQVFKGLNSESAVASAVESTKGEILTYDGKPIDAYYHSTSVGRTELPEEVFGKQYPYLKSVSSSGKLSPYSFWARTLPMADVGAALGIDNVTSVEVANRTAAGRAKTMRITHDGVATDILATDFRKAIGWMKLPSTDFTMKASGADLLISGKGFGHGVGMCQWTAYEMALDGKSYREILMHFYPGAEIRLYEDR